MIKVNLLGGPKAKKVQKAMEVQYELVLAGLLVGMAIVGCFFFLSSINSRISALNSEKAQATIELAELKKKVKVVEDFEKNKKILERKNALIEELKKNQSAPVHFLDEISGSMDPLKIWLSSLSIKSQKLELSGTAISNSDIVEFINALGRSKYFAQIQLIESRKALVGLASVYKFKIRGITVL